MTDVPNKIWAVFQEHPRGGHPYVFATAEKTKGQEYVRADIADDILKALKNLRACIMDTRGPDAYAAMKVADAVIARAEGKDT